VQLFVHTKYSFFESDIDLNYYIEELSINKGKYAAITDKNNVYGMWEFIRISKQNKIFPIVGVHIAPKIKDSLYSNGGFLLFLKSQQEIHSFNSIISTATNEKSFDYVYDKISQLSAQNRLNKLAFISLSLNSYKTLMHLSIPMENLYFGVIEDIFTIRPYLTPNLINFFENFDFPNPIFLTKIFYKNPIEDEFLNLLATCKNNLLIKRKESIFKKRKPIIQNFSSICKFYYLTEDNSFLKDKSNPYNILSNKARKTILSCIENAKNFPSLFSEIKSKKQVFPSFYIDPELKLKNICYLKLKEKGLKDNLLYLSRLNYELDIINKKGFSQYFLFVYEIIYFAKENKIIFLGRGSAASSLVSFLLGITEVDPIALKLYFERFLNPARESYPDIDLDFSWKERDKILLYLLKKYPSNSCMVSTNISMNLKGAFRNCAKFYGMDSRLITKYTKLIPSFFFTKKTEKIKNVLIELGIPEKIVKNTVKLLNLPYAKGTHPGGIVFSTPDILSSTPFLYATKGFAISHFDRNYIEDAGLIKIDLLSQRALQVLQDAIENIKEYKDKNFELTFDIANQDKKTWEKIRIGDCRGCFYIESAAMVNFLRDLEVSDFDQLVAASSVIRPGVSDSGMKEMYIFRKKNPNNFEYEIPIFKEILNDTFGIMIYQEDVLKVASIIGNLSLTDADILRKAISGKDRNPAQIALLKKKFIEGGLNNKYNLKTLEKIWKQIESFAGYAFCKAHSASYAVLSVKLAYLRTHFTPFFYAAILNNFGGFYPAIAYNIMALNENIPVDICRIKNATKFTFYDNNNIIIGLCNFFFLNENDKNLLVNISKYLRTEKDFILSRFLALLKFDKQKTIKLIQIGFFDDCYKSSFFTKTLCEYLMLENDFKLDRLIDREKEFTQMMHLFTENRLSIYFYRYKYLGLFVDSTPFQILQILSDENFLKKVEKNNLKKFRLEYNSTKLDETNFEIIGWIITYRSAVTKEGKLMGFATFFDGKNFIETVLFPDSYSRYYNLLKYYNFFILKLKFEKNSTSSFLVEELEPFLPDFFDRLKEVKVARDNKKAKTDS